MQRAWYASVAVVLVGGCPDREVSELEPEQYPVEIKDIPLYIDREVDILFVIDNSGSMDDEQMSLGANFDRFIDVLDNLDGGLPDLHIGVVSSDMGSLGVLGPGTGCDGPGDNGALHVGAAPILTGERFLVDVAGATPGTRVTNYSGDLRSAFAAAASVGITGCGFEQHLEAMNAALDNPVNAGFLRPNASLAVIIVADEDDCSARVPELFGNSPALGLLDSFRCFEFGVVCDQADLRTPGLKTGCRAAAPSPYLHDVQRYIDRLRALRPITDVVVAAIVGDREPVIVGTQMPQSGGTFPALNPSCTYGPPGPDEQSADPAIRIGEFVDAFAQRGQFETICQDDLSEPLTAIGQLIIDNQGQPVPRWRARRHRPVDACDRPGVLGRDLRARRRGSRRASAAGM